MAPTATTESRLAEHITACGEQLSRARRAGHPVGTVLMRLRGLHRIGSHEFSPRRQRQSPRYGCPGTTGSCSTPGVVHVTLAAARQPHAWQAAAAEAASPSARALPSAAGNTAAPGRTLRAHPRPRKQRKLVWGSDATTAIGIGADSVRRLARRGGVTHISPQVAAKAQQMQEERRLLRQVRERSREHGFPGFERPFLEEPEYREAWNDYARVVPEPMDMGTIRRRLALGTYYFKASQEHSRISLPSRQRCRYGESCCRKFAGHEQRFSHPTDADWAHGEGEKALSSTFLRDLRLVFSNCLLFNRPRASTANNTTAQAYCKHAKEQLEFIDCWRHQAGSGCSSLGNSEGAEVAAVVGAVGPSGKPVTGPPRSPETPLAPRPARPRGSKSSSADVAAGSGGHESKGQRGSNLKRAANTEPGSETSTAAKRRREALEGRQQKETQQQQQQQQQVKREVEQGRIDEGGEKDRTVGFGKYAMRGVGKAFAWGRLYARLYGDDFVAAGLP